MFGYKHRRFQKKFSRAAQQRNRLVRNFEALEDRRLLTTFHVTTTADLASPIAGQLSLRQAIDLANAHPGPDVIVLKAGPNDSYKITIAGAGEDNNATGDFDISDDLTIKSAGSGFPTIGGNGLDRVLDMVADGISLTLNHVIVTGGISNVGGGLHGGSDETLILTNASIKNNVASSDFPAEGGGIWLESGNLTATNSHIDNNSAAKGTTGYGGGVYIDSGTGDITLVNSTVNGNSAYSGAAGIDSGSTGVFTATNSQINNNHAGGDNGGGVFLIQPDSVTIKGSTFSGNTSGASGGGLYVGDSAPVTITKSYFCSNTAAGDGGALWTELGAVKISGSTFSNNTSTGGVGGALANVGAVTITNSTFDHNVANGVGGAIDLETDDDDTITGSTFSNNASLTDTGGAINGDGGATITITNSKFLKNSALEQGGAIAGNGDDLEISGSTFDHNSSTTDDGGAIDDAVIEATNSKFTYNTSKADGGAIDTENNVITLQNCVFSCNTATNGEGGALTDGGSDSFITADQCTFDGNTAGGNGGAIAAEGVLITLTKSTISNNRSGSDGGGIYIFTSGLNSDSAGSDILNCTISGNGAAVAGGGFDFEGDGDLTVIDDTIVFNASFNGGGIAQTDGAGVIHIGDTIVAKNIAPNGPDAYNTQTPFDDMGHNLVFANPDLLFTGPGDIFNMDPKLGPLANNGGPTKTHALLKGSPAINNGDDSFAEFTDQRGVVRGPHSDIGAYEKK